MKSISSFGSNNQNPINDREGLNNNNNNYQASYLAKDNARDEVSFSGNKKEGIKAKGFKGLLIALAATMGLSGCTPAINNKDVNASSMPETAITETADDINEPQLQTNEGQVTLLDLDSNVPVVSIVSTKKVDNEEVEVKRFPNALAIKDDMFHEGKEYNSTTHVVKTASNEQDECATLLEAINKQYADPFIHNGGDPGDFTGADLDQIAREIIEGNEDMQKKIAEYYGVENWMEADIDKVLNDNLYEMGIMEFQTPDIVEIHGISTVSPLYYKSESQTTLYSTENDKIVLDNSIKTVEDLYAAFQENYRDNSGKEISTTAASIATWLTIKDNQYNEAFEGKINNDGDRTDLMLLETLGELKDGETLELNLPKTFGLNITASGVNIEDISVQDAYHIVHEMTPMESSFTLDGSKKVMSDEDTAGLYDFVDIATLYSDPDTLEPYATKEKDENGDYIFQYNLDVADLNAKTYSLYEQFAYDHMDFFAAKQYIDVDGENKEYQFGVFDVQEGYEEIVNDLVKEGDYDSAKQYLTFNLDRFISGSFYNEDGTLKTGGDLTMSLEQYFYVNDGEGKKVELPSDDKDDVDEGEPSKPDSDSEQVPDSDTTPIPDTDSTPDTDSVPDTDADSIPDTDTDSIPDTDADSIPDTDADSIPDTDTDSIPDTDTDSIPDTDTDSIPDTDTDSIPDTDTDSIPDTDTDSIPDTDTDSVPDTDTDTDSPNPDPPVDTDTDTDSIPDTDTDSTPDTDTDSIPDTDTDSIPDTDTDTIPDTDTDSIPDTDTDSIPDTDTDSVPDTDTDTDSPNPDPPVDTDTDTDSIPDTDTDSIPDTDTDSIPDTDTDSIPDTDTDSIPDTDTDSIPDTDTDSIPDTDTDSVPDTDTDTDSPNPDPPVDTDTDTDSIPDTDTDSIPDTDTDSIPDTDTDSIPDTDTDSIPDTDTDSIPDTDTDSIPDTDTDSIPDTDTDSIPDTDTDSIPDTDTDSIPDTDTDSIPDTDTDSIPDTDTDSIPDTDTDSIPDTDTDSTPDTDTDVVPDTDTDECPPEDEVLPDMDGELKPDTSTGDETTTLPDDGGETTTTPDTGNDSETSQDTPCEDEDTLAPETGEGTVTDAPAPEPEVVAQESTPEPEGVVQESAPEPEVVVQESAPEPEVVVQESAPEPEVVVQESAPEPEVVVQESAPAETSNDSQSETQTAPLSDEVMGGEDGSELDW